MNDIFLLTDWEGLTFMDPGVCFWASIVSAFFIRSFFIFYGGLVGSSFLLLGRGFVGLSAGLSGQFREM